MNIPSAELEESCSHTVAKWESQLPGGKASLGQIPIRERENGTISEWKEPLIPFCSLQVPEYERNTLHTQAVLWLSRERSFKFVSSH